MATHLVTGATGLVGAAIVLELLATTQDDVLCLVRGDDAESAQRRLCDALTQAAEEYDRLDLLADVLQRCRAIPGDIVSALCGADVRQLRGVTHLWHSAASLRYENEHASEIHRLNVHGTGNALTLAKAIGEPDFNYVSTAYVAGRQLGVQHEVLQESLECANNVYEESKILAELSVARSGAPNWRILRPTVVVGHSVTRAVTTFSGLYGFATALLLFQRKTAQSLGALMRHRRIPFLADPAAEVNLVPVDLVARNGVRVGMEGATGKVYHLGNSTAPTVSDVLVTGFPWAGLREPRPVSTHDELTVVDELLNNAMDFYGSYLNYAKTFDQSNTEAIVGVEATRSEMTAETIDGLLSWYRERIAQDGRSATPGRTSFAYRPTRAGV